MKYFWLKFNYGVEIGARLAYIGHYKRTKDPKISEIIEDEKDHQFNLFFMLWSKKQRPSIIINLFFTIIGNIIQYLCKICPIWSLNFVARTMEIFAIHNYKKLSKKYWVDWGSQFNQMAEVEEKHRKYFESL